MSGAFEFAGAAALAGLTGGAPARRACVWALCLGLLLAIPLASSFALDGAGAAPVGVAGGDEVGDDDGAGSIVAATKIDDRELRISVRRV